MGQAAPQSKYFTKVVLFNGQKMTLFSLDGNTWSSRKVELEEIKIRHEQQRLELAGKPEDEEVIKPTKYVAEEESDPVESDYESGKKGKNKYEDSEPFSISDLEDQEDQAEPIVSRGKSVKPVKKLPAKPVSAKFNKENKKAVAKEIANKKQAPKVKLAKSNAKKQNKVKVVASKKPKSQANKKRRAA